MVEGKICDFCYKPISGLMQMWKVVYTGCNPSAFLKERDMCVDCYPDKKSHGEMQVVYHKIEENLEISISKQKGKTTVGFHDESGYLGNIELKK